MLAEDEDEAEASFEDSSRSTRESTTASSTPGRCSLSASGYGAPGTAGRPRAPACLLELFEELGARPWAERAVRSCGRAGRRSAAAKA